MELGYYYVGLCKVGMRPSLAESEQTEQHDHVTSSVRAARSTRLALFVSPPLYSSIPHPHCHRIDTFPRMDRTNPLLRPSPTTGHVRTHLVGRRRKRAPPLAARSSSGLRPHGSRRPKPHAGRAQFRSPSQFTKGLALYRFIQDFPYVFLSPFALDHLLSLQRLLP
jgi:hypothetical protein